MNRTANAIRMLRYLKHVNVAKKRELAEYLEVKPRYVLELKYELETAGYTIETMNGKHGGYRLLDQDSLPIHKLSTKMKEALVHAAPFLLSLQEPVISPQFKEAYRIIASTLPKTPTVITSMTQKWQLSKDPQLIESFIEKLSYAILEKFYVQIEYKPQSKESKRYIIEPRELTLYDGQWYVLTQDAIRKVSVFKISRIEQCTVIEQRFKHDTQFQTSKTLTPYGFSVDQPIRCKLRLSRREYMSEYIVGENQIIEWLDESTFILEATVYAKRSLIELILQLGDGCEVLQPLSIRQEIIDIYRKTLNLYSL